MGVGNAFPVIQSYRKWENIFNGNIYFWNRKIRDFYEIIIFIGAIFRYFPIFVKIIDLKFILFGKCVRNNIFWVSSICPAMQCFGCVVMYK